MHSLLLAALLAVPFVSVSAQAPATDNIRDLDDAVQDVKAEALDIAAELNLLEERLLYPAETRLTVSLALGSNRDVLLSRVEIHLDGDLAAHHVYSAAEQEALRKGGVHPLFRGNVADGTHEVEVRIVGKTADGASLEKTRRQTFTKTADTGTLDIAIDHTGRDDDGIRIAGR
jgi:hypothetical protein